MQRIAFFIGLLVLAAFATPTPATADVLAHIDISRQSMTVKVDGRVRYVWPVSTARRGKITPRGTFRPQSMRRMHYSSRYNNAPMPHSVFFRGNYAIHGTTEIQHLGRPASAGCVRLHPDNARVLFELIQRRGRSNARIVVS